MKSRNRGAKRLDRLTDDSQQTSYYTTDNNIHTKNETTLMGLDITPNGEDTMMKGDHMQSFMKLNNDEVT